MRRNNFGLVLTYLFLDYPGGRCGGGESDVPPLHRLYLRLHWAGSSAFLGRQKPGWSDSASTESQATLRLDHLITTAPTNFHFSLFF